MSTIYLLMLFAACACFILATTKIRPDVLLPLGLALWVAVPLLHAIRAAS